MPATSAVFRNGVIGSAVVPVLVAVGRTAVVAMFISFSGSGECLLRLNGGHSELVGFEVKNRGQRQAQVADFWSRPRNAAWSTTGPWMMVAPSPSWVSQPVEPRGPPGIEPTLRLRAHDRKAIQD
jgi:hypothetical protein